MCKRGTNKTQRKKIILYSAFLKGYNTGAGPKVTGTKLTEEIGKRTFQAEHET